MINLTEILRSVKKELPRIGDYQLSFYRKPEAVQGYQKSPREVVSKIDIESEKMLRDMLGKIIPEAAFYGEETSKDIGEEYTWVVDPIDGTLNFLHGIAEWCISIGLLYKKEPVLGIIYRPVSQEIFSAAKGHGAWLDDRRLPLYGFNGKLEDSFIATGMPFRSPDVAKGYFESAQELLTRCQEIRRMGSAALDLAYCAAGFFHGYWETDLRIYDICAALVLLQEAGIPYQNFFGEPYDHFTGRTLLVAREEIMDDLTQLITKHYDQHKDILQEGFDQKGENI